MPDEVIVSIPSEILKFIPLFNGDKRQLALYIKKCEYVIDLFSRRGNEDQNIYVFHAITSRLTDNAAALLSEREDIVSWSGLKDLLTQHFGDPRSEECINIELESLKIKPSESYLDFCNRIQSVRSLLISKVNILDNPELKIAKTTIYNHTALNVFMYNLPEDMVRIVRLKAPTSLENALSIVLEEVNFHDQYNSRKRLHHGTNNNFAASRPPLPQSSGFRFPSPPINNSLAPKFNFGTQAAQLRTPHTQSQNFGYRPQFGYRAPQFGNNPPQQGFRPQLGFNQPQLRPAMPPQQFGYRPFQAPQQFGYKPPQQLGYKPPPQLGYTPPQQLGYKPPQPQPSWPEDVTMRTAPHLPRDGFRVNELTGYEDEQYYYDGLYSSEFGYDTYEQFTHNEEFGQQIPYPEETHENSTQEREQEAAENFHEEASIKSKK